MKANTTLGLRWCYAILAIGLFTPSVVIFCLEVFVGGINPFSALNDVLSRQFATGHNLFLIALLGLIPFVLLSCVAFTASHGTPASRVACISIGGLLGILRFMVPAHISVWYPLYGGRHMSSTAVIAFFFIPFYCLGSLTIGLIGGWLISLLPPFCHVHRPVA